MRKLLYDIGLLLLCTIPLSAQITYTANDQVPTYEGHFRFGANMGAYSNWSDDDLANIAIGNPALGLEGAGVRSLRPPLPEYFLESWGYDIRVNTFKHYANLGAGENTVFIGFPSSAHQDPTQYCNGIQSQLFANMYTDIWDGGANGTPVNDNNYYALYLYKMVTLYRDQVRFWEIWNEPDFDFSGNGWKPKGIDGNWFDNIPDPCDYTLRAPIFHYIRLLRISYEVIKYVDPSAYVAVGGLGYPGFLDLILRHSDHPDNGSVTANYPLKGGAYFDVLSYHSYPHFDGSLRYWSDDAGGFVHTRHSDAAMEGVIGKKEAFQSLLYQYGYNGNTYPEKLWIITESNLPRKAFGEYIGSSEAQRNFLIKTLVACQQEKIWQYHLYTMADAETEANASNEFQVMGLFKKLEGTLPYQQQPNEVAIAGKTFQKILYGKKYDPDQTAKLQLPNRIRGGAFKDENSGEFTYVLWAKTKNDRSENANANYTFPAALGIDNVERKFWDYVQTGYSESMASYNIGLKGAPAFFTATDGPTAIASPESGGIYLNLTANPSQQPQGILQLENSQNICLRLYDSQGRLIRNLMADQFLPAGQHQLTWDSKGLADGLYFLQLTSAQDQQVTRWLKGR